jgi:hypothetical protein
MHSQVFNYVNFARFCNFFEKKSSMLVTTTYAVPPRGRRPYTDAHFTFLGAYSRAHVLTPQEFPIPFG